LAIFFAESSHGAASARSYLPIISLDTTRMEVIIVLIWLILRKDGYPRFAYSIRCSWALRSVIILLGNSVVFLLEVLKISIFIMEKRC